MFLERRLFPFVAPVPAIAAWPVIFVLGIAAGTMLAGRVHNAAQPSPIINRPTNAPFQIPASSVRTSDARHPVEVTRTIDGDTFEARVHLWPGLDMTTRVRLRGIDAPELKAACAEELQMAQAASGALQDLLAEGDVTIFNIGPDKYNGRVVADAATRRTPNISQALLAMGHARSYAGGRRSGWCAR